ncbi:MAG: aromatic amino acid lyase [Deltaproteobacteria bacterium]|nr:aromatic amino acid lyase [Deltaproteobacteria bacterium]
MRPKEGLSLINGTSLNSAQAIEAWYEANNLIATANLAAAMSIVAMRGDRLVLRPELIKEHRHYGTIRCGQEI